MPCIRPCFMIEIWPSNGWKYFWQICDRRTDKHKKIHDYISMTIHSWDSLFEFNVQCQFKSDENVIPGNLLPFLGSSPNETISFKALGYMAVIFVRLWHSSVRLFNFPTSKECLMPYLSVYCWKHFQNVMLDGIADEEEARRFWKHKDWTIWW